IHRRPAGSALAQVQAACDFIRTHPEKRHTLSKLAGRVGASPFHFQRTFTQLVGISPHAYAEACRLGRLKSALRKGSKVTPAMYDAGYGSSSRVYERAGTAFGMTPATYRRGGWGAKIALSIAESPVGRLLVAATARGGARACATNPVALLVPCHRVVRTDGSMGGYRWGIERKEKLIADEKERRSRG